MNYLRSLLLRMSKRIEHLVLRRGSRPVTIFILALLACMDGFVPMLPAEVFVIALAILQPSRGKLIVMIFALSAGVSALLLSLLLHSFDDAAQWLGMQTFDAQWDQAKAILHAAGPGILVFASVFPDSPRPSIAVLTFSGIFPVCIGSMVFIGKLFLYATLVALLRHLPERWGNRKPVRYAWQKWRQRRSRRLLAYRRRIASLAQQSSTGI